MWRQRRSATIRRFVVLDPMHGLLPGEDEQVRERACHGGSICTCGGNMHTKRYGMCGYGVFVEREVADVLHHSS